jgi:hypothetical protein
VSRPTDWQEVFGIDDPTPGDPWEIRGVRRSWSTLAEDAEWAEGKVRSLIGDPAISGWVGEGGDAFRGKTDDLPDQLRKCHESYSLAASALDTWATRLETHQADADAALVRGREALNDLESAQTQLSGAQTGLESASGSGVLALVERYGDTTPPADVPMPTAEQVSAAQGRLRAAQAAQSAAQGGVSEAQGRLDAAKQLALDAGQLRVDDGKAAAETVREASDAGIQERSWWQKAKEALAEAWDILVEVCKVVVLVLGVVALIIGGPLAWVVLAAALVLLADAIMKYLNGEGGLGEVLLAAVGCIPGVRGLTTLKALSAAFKGGRGLLGAGAHLLGAAGYALKGMGASFRSLANLRHAGAMLAREADWLRVGFLPGMRATVGGFFRGGGGPMARMVRADAALWDATGDAWSAYQAAVTTVNPARGATMWQGEPMAIEDGADFFGQAAYPGMDSYTNFTLQPGTQLEAGSPGVGYYSTDAGTAAASGFDSPTFFEGVQVGPRAPDQRFPGYRPEALQLEVVEPITVGTGTTAANPQYGAGGSTQYFFDINGALDSGALRSVAKIPLANAKFPQPGIPSLQEVQTWVNPTLRAALIGLRGGGYFDAGTAGW